MELSIKNLVLFGAIILTGLSAGFFYSWQVSVIPGTKRILDPTYLETMQSINRAILNPAFFTIFFGSLILLGISVLIGFQSDKLFFALILSSFITYLVGPFGITAFGNVPLNDQLDIMSLTELSASKAAEFRQYYESKWNQLHLTRTILSVISFLLAMAALFIQTKKL